MGNSFSTPSLSSPASGYYTNQTALENKFGAEQIRLWSNPDNTNLGTNVTAVQYALTLADDEINRFFDNGPYAVPLSAPIPAVVADWANDLSAYWIYTNRGIVEKNNEMGGKLTKLRNEVYARMALCKGGSLTLPCARRWPSPTAPVAV